MCACGLTGKEKVGHFVRLTAQLEQIDIQIQKEQEKRKDLEAKKKELLDLKKKQEFDDLYTQIRASGKSVEEVVAVLKSE